MVIHYCRKCGQRVDQADLDAGSARKDEDGILCAICGVASPLRRDSRRQIAPQAARASAVPAPSDRHHAPASQQAAHHAKAASSSSRLVLVGVLICGGLGLILALLFASEKTPSTVKPARTGNTTGTAGLGQMPAEAKGGTNASSVTSNRAGSGDDDYDPRDTVARVRLLQAKASAEKYPEDKWDHYRLLQAIRDEYAGTKTADEAMRLQSGMGLSGPAPANIAGKGTASSPDDLERDGSASGDSAAIDGNPETFWDEADGKQLYRLKIDFSTMVKIVGIRILGFEHHHFAPRDFEIRCDDAMVKEVRGATYESNRLRLVLPVTHCRSVELKITGYYGGSPAIRELEIMGWPSSP